MSMKWSLMRMTPSGTMQRILGCLAALGIIGMGWSAHAAQVKLTDGTEVSATVVGRDGQNITLRLPRASVASIDGKPLPAPVIAGSQAPTFSVVDLSGAPQTLGSAAGEVTLLHFWASWCPHCRHDVDLMKELYAKYQGKGVRVVTVSVDQDMKALSAFLEALHGAGVRNTLAVAYPGTAEGTQLRFLGLLDPTGGYRGHIVT